MLHSSPKTKTKTLTSMSTEKLPITGHATIISTIFFPPFHPSKSKGEYEFRQCLRQSGGPACDFLKCFGCFFFCWVTPQAETEGWGGVLGRTGPEAELTQSAEAQGRPQSLQPERKSRNGQTHSMSCFIRG